MKLLLDSSVYLSFFLQDEKDSENSLRFMEWIKEQGEDCEIVVFRMVLFEVANVLMKKFDLPYHEVSPQYLAAMIYQSGGGVIEMSDDFEKRMFDVYDHGVQLKTADLLVYLAAFNAEAELVTWDKQLICQTNKVWKAKMPTEYFS
jgi:predicted nucleic acid-binding protein